MTDRDEEMVRSALRGVRDAEMLTTPSFESVLARDSARRRVRPNWPVLAAAAAVVVALASSYAATRRPPLTVPAEVLALSTWTSPTDALLQGARSHTELPTPRFGVSLLDTLNGENR